KNVIVQPSAHACITPAADDDDTSAMPTPRTRGDHPGSTRKIQITHLNPPHTRGSTRPYGERHGPQTQPPAHAGINPGRGPCRRRRVATPRTRGDQPGSPAWARTSAANPPHTRGSTLDGRIGTSLEEQP